MTIQPLREPQEPKRSSQEQAEYLKTLIANYPIDSIEDGYERGRLGRMAVC